MSSTIKEACGKQAVEVATQFCTCDYRDNTMLTPCICRIHLIRKYPCMKVLWMNWKNKFKKFAKTPNMKHIQFLWRLNVVPLYHMNIVIIMVLVPLPPMNTIYLMLVRIVYIIIMVGICFLFFDRYAKYMMLALHIPIMDSYTPLFISSG